MNTALRTGLTTGTCAAAAAQAAARVLCGEPPPEFAAIRLPGGELRRLAVEQAELTESGARAAVRKDAGDDPDVTHGLLVWADVVWTDGGDVTFRAGPGVGTVTRPGLQIPPGEPAINPVPRAMIRAAVRDVTARPMSVTISVPGGEAVAQKTFNPKLGIVGGLSILGSTGIVRPYSLAAVRDSFKCALDVAQACGVRCPVLVPGNTGRRGASLQLHVADEQVIEVGNEWGFMAHQLAGRPFEAVLALGHPGKLAKLAAGWWDTHSSRSPSALPLVRETAAALGLTPPVVDTVEGVFQALAPADSRRLGEALAERVREALASRLGAPAAVMLVDMPGARLGCAGDLTPWTR
jgi:cobalt-precorrin-5B (C1)-methyltransferase